jgi:hypothetical protein
MKKAMFLISSIILLCFWVAAQENALRITNGPVIEAVSNRSVVIAWSTNAGGSSVVKYGTSPNNLDRTAKSPDVEGGSGPHRVKVEPLEGATTYYFQVISGQGQARGAEAKSDIVQVRTLETAGTLTPIYRMVKGVSHLFTASHQETQRADDQGFKSEGIAFYVSQTPMQGTVPLYRLFNASNSDHFYTTNEAEMKTAVGQGGYTSEGTLGHIGPSQLPGTVPLYRLLHPTSQHFYTTSDAERQRSIAGGNAWKDEGIAGYVWTQGTETK